MSGLEPLRDSYTSFHSVLGGDLENKKINTQRMLLGWNEWTRESASVSDSTKSRSGRRPPPYNRRPRRMRAIAKTVFSNRGTLMQGSALRVASATQGGGYLKNKKITHTE